MREIDQLRELGATQQAAALMAAWNKRLRTQTKDWYIVFYKSEVLVALDDVINDHPLLGKQTFLNKPVLLCLKDIALPLLSSIKPVFRGNV